MDTSDQQTDRTHRCPLNGCTSPQSQSLTMEAHIVTDHGIDRRVAKELTKRVFPDE